MLGPEVQRSILSRGEGIGGMGFGEEPEEGQRKAESAGVAFQS